MICTLNKKVSFHAGIMGGDSVGYFINVNNERRKKLGLLLGELVEVHLEKDRSEYGMPMSDELREVFNQEEEASKIFHSLTAGKQRSLIYWTDNVKSSQIKIRRALVLVNHLLANKDNLDFKTLNAELKEANQRAKRGV